MTLITTKLKSGGLHEKHVVALGKLGTTSAFAFRPRKTKKNLCRGCSTYSRGYSFKSYDYNK
jgi:hypothetical protein